ncbi:MAG: hypothetical protein D3910_27945, partial [Candidatus Electrothrix sp. ATG2]|nr:hypothetical protein [Candidatus Electrothrix sp. ATG2]
NRFYSVVIDGTETGTELDRGGLAHHLLARVAYCFVHTIGSGIVLRSGAVQRNGKGILLPGSEKNNPVPWLLERGYGYLTDKLVHFKNDSRQFSAFSSPPLINQSNLSAAADLCVEEFISSVGDQILSLPNSSSFLVPYRIFTDDPIPEEQQLNLLLFTKRQQNLPLSLTSVSPGQAAQRLMGYLENHQLLSLQGFRQIAELTRQVPALLLQYADFEQLDDLLLPVIDFILDTELPLQAIEKFTNTLPTLIGRQRSSCTEQTTTTVYPLQQATPPGKKKKITVGMATYDDYDGVYFSVQALRMYHPEIIDQCEILVIDNHPDGPCAESLKKLDAAIPGYRYVPLADVQGTAAARDALFQHS